MKGIGSFGLVIALGASLCMVGCVSNRHRTNEAKSYVNGQLSAIEKQKPIVEFIAAEGQQITLGGVKEFRVYAPRDTRIQALPQQRSALVDVGLRLLDRGAQVAGYKFASEALTAVFDKAASNAGDHSVTYITDSNNDSSDHSRHGDTITGSNLIGGDVTGDGAGIGNALDESIDVSGDGSAVGEANELINGNNANNSGTIREDSPGPIVDVDDHSDDGDDCTGNCDELPPIEDPTPEVEAVPLEAGGK